MLALMMEEGVLEPLEVEKVSEMDSLWELPEGMKPAWYLDFSSVENHFWTSDA